MDSEPCGASAILDTEPPPPTAISNSALPSKSSELELSWSVSETLAVIGKVVPGGSSNSSVGENCHVGAKLFQTVVDLAVSPPVRCNADGRRRKEEGEGEGGEEEKEGRGCV